jgi:hypothetical protein
MGLKPPSFSGAPNTFSVTAAAEHAVATLRAALSDALYAIGVAGSKPQQLSRALRLDKSLGWKLAKLTTEPHAMVATRYLPGRPGQRIILQALELAGVPAQVVWRVRDALDGMDKVIETHAGDRETFDLMIASAFPSLLPETELSCRRQGFVGNSASWGARARVHYSGQMLVVDSNGLTVSLATVVGLSGLQRLREGLFWPVARPKKFRGAEGLSSSSIQPLAARSGQQVFSDDCPLIEELCSPGVQVERVRDSSDGLTRFDVPPGMVGKTGQVDVFSGWVERSTAPAWASKDEREGVLFMQCSTPCEVLIHDVYIQRDYAKLIDLKASILSGLPGGMPILHSEQSTELQSGEYTNSQEAKLESSHASRPLAGAIPVSATIEELGGFDGSGKEPLSEISEDLATVPRMVELLRRGLGVDRTNLVGYRYRVDFPPMPSQHVYSFALPARR